MCPVCLAMSGLYDTGGVVGRRRHDLLATKLLRKRPEPTASTTLPPKQKETTMQRPTIVSSSVARPTKLL